MHNGESLHQSFLRNELSRRVDRNPRYSLRAFAKTLGVDVAVLSRTLNGKRRLSPSLAERISTRLDLDPKQKQKFLTSVSDSFRKNSDRPRAKKSQSKADASPHLVSMETFRIVANWYHYAILELTFTEGFQSDNRWIAKALGITITEARMAVDRLLQAGLLDRVDGVLRKAHSQLTTADKELTSVAHRKHQKQLYRRAIDALDNDPLSHRVSSGMTMAIDPSLIPQARKEIDHFMEQLCKRLETGSRTAVYQLCTTLFPLQKL